MKKKPLVLMILDGWGYSESKQSNAIMNAKTPYWDNLWKQYPRTLINASGKGVGLPNNQMGNSEVGHVNIGSGRVVYQELTRIDQEIDNGEFQKNVVLNNAISNSIIKNKALHIMGLLSSGGVHSHINHIKALITSAYQQGIRKIYVHAFLDGRDTPPRSALQWIKEIDALLYKLNIGKIISICGRYYAMDRDNRWDRIESAYNLITKADAHYYTETASQALQMAYDRNENDEFVKATSILIKGEKVYIEENDTLVFINFRADRARELSHAFTDENFSGFTRKYVPNCQFITLTQYSEDISAPCAYPPIKLKNGLGEYLSNQGLTQLRIAETEKYAHVTFFFNGGVEKPFPGEDRTLINSPKVATYDLQPEMSAYEVTDKMIAEIERQSYDIIICNYANSDMVGHTGNYDAAISAIEALDKCIEKVIDALKKYDGEALITADHGNADLMLNPETGVAHTAHTTNPVPLLYIGRDASFTHKDGCLADIAPTILEIMNLKQPVEMTGRSLLKIKTTN